MNSELLHRAKTQKSSESAGSGADWLAWLSVLVSDREWLGLFEFGPEPDVLLRRHGFPEGGKAPECALELARKARAAKRPIARVLNVGDSDDAEADKNERTLSAFPLNDAADRILVTVGSAQKPAQQAGLFKLCRWAGERLEYTQDLTVTQQPIPDASNTMESLPSAVVHAAYQYSTPEAIALSLVNTTKRLCGCSRVTLAVLPMSKSIKALRVIAMSDQAEIDERKVLPSQLKASMQEQLLDRSMGGLSGESVSSYSNQFPSTVTLFAEQGQHPSMSVVYPEVSKKDRVALINGSATQNQVVVLLERPSEQPFTEAQQRAIQTLLDPSLDLVSRRMGEQRRLRSRVKQRIKEKLNYGYLRELGLRRPGLTVACCLLMASLFIPVEHRVTASASIEAKDLHVMVAPQNGFVATSHVRAGEAVEKGQLLATLDAQDLNLAVNKWRSEQLKNQQAVDLALATRDRVSLGRLRADTARIAAEQALVERQLKRAELRAPFDGIVLSGDFSQRLGAAVTQGETLFKVAASDEYRLVLDIKEQDVGLVGAGQLADVRMSALPNQTWRATVEAVLPVATTTADANVFRVPAKLTERPDSLLPGMEGVAKLHAGSRSLAWVYTRSLREKLKVLAWRMGVIR